jgi:uncharacterized coiled-coil DUF342 family protein
MTIIEINQEINRIREERDRLVNQEQVLTNCILSLAAKREELRREITGDTLFDDMFGG